MYYKGKEYYTLYRWVRIFNKAYKEKGIKVDRHKLWVLFSYYYLKPVYKHEKYPIFSVNGVNQIRTQKEDFMQILKMVSNGEIPSRENKFNKEDYEVADDTDYEYPLEYKNHENNMEEYSKELEKKYNMESKKISGKRLSKILHESIKNVLKLNEINHIAEKSPITVCSYNDFCEICKNQIKVNDINVENLIGKFCFIEIGSTKDRCIFDYRTSVGYDNYKSGEDYYENYQFYFKQDHPNVLRLIFDDNMSMVSKHQPISLSKYEVKPELWKKKNGEPRSDNSKYTDYYDNGKAFDFDMAKKATQFIENNIEKGGNNLKFVIHCRQGASRSAAFGFHIANLIKTDLNEYLSEYEYDNPDGTRTSQFNINFMPKYDKNHNLVYNKKGEISGKRSLMNHRVYNMLTNYLYNREMYDKNGFNFSEDDLNKMGKKPSGEWVEPYINFLSNYAKKNNLRKRQRLNPGDK